MTPGSFQDAVCQRFELRLAMLVVLMPLGTASI